MRYSTIAVEVELSWRLSREYTTYTNIIQYAVFFCVQICGIWVSVCNTASAYIDSGRHFVFLIRYYVTTIAVAPAESTMSNCWWCWPTKNRIYDIYLHAIRIAQYTRALTATHKTIFKSNKQSHIQINTTKQKQNINKEERKICEIKIQIRIRTQRPSKDKWNTISFFFCGNRVPVNQFLFTSFVVVKVTVWQSEINLRLLKHTEKEKKTFQTPDIWWRLQKSIISNNIRHSNRNNISYAKRTQTFFVELKRYTSHSRNSKQTISDESRKGRNGLLSNRSIYSVEQPKHHALSYWCDDNAKT